MVSKRAKSSKKGIAQRANASSKARNFSKEQKSKSTKNTIIPIQKTPRYSFSTQIPESYNESYVCALPRDPDWLFVYWETAPENRDKMSGEQNQIGSKLVLKLNEVSHRGPNETKFEVEVDRKNKNWYIQIPSPGKEYQVEYGKRNPYGDFLPIISTEPVKSRPSSVSEYIDKSWTSKTTSKIIDFSASKQNVKKTGKSENITLDKPYLGSASL